MLDYFKFITALKSRRIRRLIQWRTKMETFIRGNYKWKSEYKYYMLLVYQLAIHFGRKIFVVGLKYM